VTPDLPAERASPAPRGERASPAPRGERASAARWTPWRRLTQAAAALGWLALPLLGAPWMAGTPAALRVGPVELVEPAGALSVALAAGAPPLALVLGVLPLVALALLLGPVACSWLCPWGLLSEGLDRLRWGRSRWPERPWERAGRPRWVALTALLGLSALLGAPLAAVLSPPRLAAALPLEAWTGRVVPWVTGGLLLGLLALELLAPRRLICRALCPAGALAVLLRRPSTFGPRFTPGACRCPEHPPCQQACAWGLDPRQPGALRACTSCMACLDRCPSGALVTPGWAARRAAPAPP
jgi:ferredoxin-type protein NapH